jgi:hypothetical protein
MTTRSAKKRRFDCVEMMHRGAAPIRKELEGKSLEEQVAYWDKDTEALLKRQARLREKRNGSHRPD